MAPKKKKNWDDAKMVISALSVTATLAMWNIFAANNKSEHTQVVEIPPEPVVFIEPTPVAAQPPFTGKILLGGEAPKPRVVVVQAKSGGNGGNNNNNGGGGGGNVTTQTSSS